MTTLPKSSLLSLEQAHQLLAHTEPLTTQGISDQSKVKFKLEPDWALSIDAVEGNSPVNVFMSVNGDERQMTKDAVFQAAANFGLQAAYIKKVPAHYIEQLLNYHYSGGMGNTEFNVLAVKGNVAAFTRPTFEPYSNIELLDEVVEGIQNFYGANTEILVDYKFRNTLPHTDIRLIVPERTRDIKDGGMKDIPAGAADTWSVGINLSNSAIGKSMTSLDAYLFRWVCSNGATISYDGVGAWSRKTNGDIKSGEKFDFDVYEWARVSVDAILGGMEDRFSEIQALTALKTAGNTADIFREIFAEYSVPKSQQAEIAETLLEQPVLSMYTIMNSITQAANDPSMDPSRADKLMRIGGDIPTHTFDTIKAKVWREGHEADKKAVNPYTPVVA